MAQGRQSRRGRTLLAAITAGMLAVPLVGMAEATPRQSDSRNDVAYQESGDYNHGKPLPFSKQGVRKTQTKKSTEFKVGTTRRWPALDDYNGAVYTKNYVLRGVGDKIEVWVAKDISFPAGDCRNTVGGGEGVVVTNAQVASFIKEFDDNMYPAESDAFSVAPDRNGSITPLTRAYAQFYGLPARNFKGQGDRTVTLIDNVRDSNYFTPTAADGKTYIAGFFYSLFNEYTNRNVMTIDAWDWIHRVGVNPPDDSDEADYVACGNFLGRPFGDPRTRLYEGTFAHEYQHLLEYYADTDEVSWINEGLSDWAQTLVGYVDPSLDPADSEADSHIATWLGFTDDPAFGGPEQSLTQWEDQGAPEILADYGMAYSFQEYVWSHFGGNGFMSFLHNNNKNGLVGLQAALNKFGYDVKSQQVVHDFLASMAVDQLIDQGSTVASGDGDALQTDSMSARINWETPQAYSDAGAPTNGADYVKLSDGNLSFDGASSFPTSPTEWTKDGDRLYSGSGDNLDRGIARQVTIPAANPTITVDLEYQTELSWDFAFVQVFDETKGEWVSLENANTTFDADPQADPAVVANLPGFTGSSGGITEQTFDMSDYAGDEVSLAVRYISDASVIEPGVWVSGLSVGGVDVPDATDLSAWESLSESHPTPVDGWTVQLVGWNDNEVSVVPLHVTAANGWTAEGDVSDLLGINPTFAGAIVTVDDPSELINQYGRYQLKLDGVLQDGGRRS